MIPANLSIFREDYAPRSTRVVPTADGSASVYSALAVGRIVGQGRTIPALVCEEIGTEDKWHVINMYVAGGYMGTVAVLGATSGEQAGEWVGRQILPYLSGGQSSYCACDGVASAEALQAVLDSAATSVIRLPIRQKDIDTFEGRITDSPVVWDNDALQSHTAAELIHELAKHDRDGQMMDAMCKDDLPKVVSQYDGIFELFDALIVDYNRLGLMQDRLFAAMHKANVGSVKPLTVTPTKPFKRNGVTNVAVLFEMDDGQTVTIIFHSPDATPAKLGPKDTLTSWKWLLNKRDVTVAVAPDNGENVQLPALARRILLLVEKNSARFKRTNVKKAEQMQDLADTTSRVEQKTAALDGLNAEIEGLQKQIDAGVAAPVAANNADDLDRVDAIRELAETEMFSATQESDVEGAVLVLEKAKGYGIDAVKMALNTVNLYNPGMMDDLANHYSLRINSESGIALVPTVDGLSKAIMGGKSDTGSIPVRVERDVISAVQSLQASAKSLDQVIRVRGHGFNLEEARKEMQPKIDSNMATLQKYRDAAAGNGASDALESLISANGGVPDFAQYQQALEDDAVSSEAAPVILTGKELGDFPDTPEGKKALRKAAIAEFEKMTAGDGDEWVECPDLGEAVELRRVGIKKVVSLSADSRKLMIVPKLKELIKSSKKVGDEKPNYDAGNSQNIVAYQTMRSQLSIDGNELAVRFVLGRDDKGHYHYDHTIHAAEAIFDSAIENGPAEADPSSSLVGGSRGHTHDRSAVSEPCRLLPAEPSAEHQTDQSIGAFDSAVKPGQWVLNLFIEGEEPEVIEEEAVQPAKNRALDQKIKLVADSVEKVRKQDVQRLIESIEGKTRAKRNEARKEMADYLKASRPDLAEEVDAVLFDLQEDLEVEPDDLARFGQVEITSQGGENIYFTKDGQKYFSKVMGTERFPEGQFDFAAYPDGLPKAAPAQPAAPASNPDADLLNAIISGTTSAADVDMDALIAIAEKYDGKPEMEGLVNQALEVVTQYELDAAKAIG